VLLGIHLSLMIGPTVPVPAPATLTESLTGVEVTHNDEGPSGFELIFQVGRSGLTDLADYPLLASPLLLPFSRVIVVATFNARPRVLVDGFITRQQLAPSNEPGQSTFTVTGEDVSVMMDLEQKKQSHTGQGESGRVRAILAQYTALLLQDPVVALTDPLEVPAPTETIPTQSAVTDRTYMTDLAGRFGFVFYVIPGPSAGQNLAYWGPPKRDGVPQPALSVNMGPSTNVDQIGFTYEGLAATTVKDEVQVSDTNEKQQVTVLASKREPPLASMPSPQFNQPNVRVSTLGARQAAEGTAEPQNRGGMTSQQAKLLAQSMVDKSADKVVTAAGELDSLRYGEILTPRGLVGLRGAGFLYDGHYYVKSVTHSIHRGGYKQRFTLTREGVGSTTPFVRT
jgi:hypothetical protein